MKRNTKYKEIKKRKDGVVSNKLKNVIMKQLRRAQC